MTIYKKGTKAYKQANKKYGKKKSRKNARKQTISQLNRANLRMRWYNSLAKYNALLKGKTR